MPAAMRRLAVSAVVLLAVQSPSRAARWGPGRAAFGAGGVSREGQPAGVRAMVPRRRRFMSSAAILLAALGGKAQASADVEFARDLFVKADEDGDGWVTLEDFLPAEVEMMSEDLVSAHKGIFSQADITEDGKLSFPEYQFAAYLVHDRVLAEDFESLTEVLPPGFKHRFEEFFVELGTKTGRNGVPWRKVRGTYKAYFGDIKLGRYVLKKLFLQADVTKDGRLNGKELQYFRYILREAMVQAVLEPLRHATGQFAGAHGGDPRLPANPTA